MNQRRDLSPVVVNHISVWLSTVEKHPQVTLGEWLYAFGAMSALALRSQNITKEQYAGAVEYLNEALSKLYSSKLLDTKTVIQ
jgi:hypothetical protein